MRIQCSGAGVEYSTRDGSRKVLSDISLSCGRGEFVSVVGASGCGKTTLLRLLAGMLAPSEGEVSATPESNDGPGGILLVRQEGGLFPWMTAIENAAFGLEMQGVPSQAREEWARAALAGYGLEGFERAYPYQLSSGMKQRVAVIRAFLSQPAILLMDEPFGALDPLTRLSLQQELAAAYEERTSLGVVFVTHDIDEAILLSDRVLCLSGSPGGLTREWKIDLPRPRRAESTLAPAFIACKRELLGALGITHD